MALLPTPHRLTHPDSPTVCVLPLSSPFGTFSVYLSTGSPSSLSSKLSLDMAFFFFFFFLKVQPVDVSVTPVQPRPWQVGFNNFFNRQQGGGFDHLPKMSRCSGGHVFILHPSPPMYVTNENYFLPLFQAKEKTDLTKHARRQHPPPQYVQVSFSLSRPSSASPITPGHPPPTLHALESSGNAGGWKDCSSPRRCRLRAASGSALDSSRPSPTKGTQLIDRGADQTESKTNWSRPSRVWLRPSCLFKPAFLPRAGRGGSVVCGQS